MIKWHDLKANPDDLPKSGDEYNVFSKTVIASYRPCAPKDTPCKTTLAYYTYRDKTWKWVDTPDIERVERWAYIEYEEDAKPSPRHDLTELRDAILEAANEINEVAKDNLKRVKEIDGTLTVGATIAIYTAAYADILLAVVKGFADYGK